MLTIHSEDHRLHFPQGELNDGELVTPFERPSRVEYVLAELRGRGRPAPLAPDPLDMALVSAVHDAGYLAFLETGWDYWVASGARGEMIPTCFPVPGMRRGAPPAEISGRAGYYAHSAETAITGGTWAAARASAACAQTAQRRVSAGARAAFALCRPPGHHAHGDLFGGYCFLNNAAIAAEGFRRDGAARVAVLDVDFHHGNGTQDIFWRRGDVFFASIHGDPAHAYPYFLGGAGETGAGPGEGATANWPLPPGTGYGPWSAALDAALARIAAFGAEALVVSLGVDAFERDPISFFRLTSQDFRDCGRRIGRAGLPTVFCLEGGYAVAEIGVNVVNVLDGFEDA
jgi:acetoin utilization deacetylase AcuC-like enzyme